MRPSIFKEAQQSAAQKKKALKNSAKVRRAKNNAPERSPPLKALNLRLAGSHSV
jgi:hypothetical protein